MHTDIQMTEQSLINICKDNTCYIRCLCLYISITGTLALLSHVADETSPNSEVLKSLKAATGSPNR